MRASPAGGTAAEVDEGFLGSDQILQPDDQQAVGEHLLSSEAAFGAIELVLPGIGAKQQLIAMHSTVAVEDGLSGDKDIHARLSAGFCKPVGFQNLTFRNRLFRWPSQIPPIYRHCPIVCVVQVGAKGASSANRRSTSSNNTRFGFSRSINAVSKLLLNT